MLAKNLETANIETPIEVIDIDEDQEKAIEYQVRSVPTLVMVENDTEVKRNVGLISTKQLEDWAN
jgi:thioredoxin 1